MNACLRSIRVDVLGALVESRAHAVLLRRNFIAEILKMSFFLLYWLKQTIVMIDNALTFSVLNFIQNEIKNIEKLE